MSKERIGGITPQKARHIYNDHFIPALSKAVSDAEMARQDGDHRLVERIFERWVRGQRDQKDQRVMEKLEQISHRAGVDLTSQKEEIKVGYAGLGRIEHVDANSQSKSAVEEKEIFPLTRIDRAKNLYDRLGLETLVPWTIHGGSIHWLSEVAQDSAKTSRILGNEARAEKILKEAINATAAVCDKFFRRVNLQMSEDQLKEQDYEAWKERKIYLGSLSALGVLYARWGKSLYARWGKSSIALPNLTYGLNLALEASQYEPNPHRIATLSLWTLSASRSYSHEKRAIRKKACLAGVKGLAHAFKRDPGQTLSALIQFAKEGG